MLDPFAAMQAEADDEELDDLKDRVEELEATKTVMSSKIEKERAAGDKKVEAARLAEQKEQRVKEDLTAARIRTLWNLFPGHEAAGGGGGGGGGGKSKGDEPLDSLVDNMISTLKSDQQWRESMDKHVQDVHAMAGQIDDVANEGAREQELMEEMEVLLDRVRHRAS